MVWEGPPREVRRCPNRIDFAIIVRILIIRTAMNMPLRRDLPNEDVGMSMLDDSAPATVSLERGSEENTGSPAPVPGTRYDLRVLQALRQIIHAVDRHSRHLVGKHRITGPQLITILTIEKNEPVTASTLAARIYLSPSTMIGILDRLEAKDLIRRARDSKDRRLVYVTLTDAGRALASHAPSPLQDTLAKALGQLPEIERIMIAESLERIAGLMQADHIDAAPVLDIGRINSPPGSRHV